MPDTSEEIRQLQQRLQETEIKCAFLEKETKEYGDAVQTLHARLSILEEKIRRLEGESQPGDAKTMEG